MNASVIALRTSLLATFTAYENSMKMMLFFLLRNKEGAAVNGHNDDGT